MKQLLVKYDELEKEVLAEYNKLVSYIQQEINLDNGEEDNEDDLTIISIADEIYGGCYEVYLTQFNPDGTFIGRDIEDRANITEYDIYNITSLYNQIKLVEVLESVVMKQLDEVIKK